MPDLDYGYEVTIAQNATSIPEHTPTNQWQRKKPGESSFESILRETGPTYTIQDEDRSASIRLQQDMGGKLVYSNALTVTSAAPTCPFQATSLPQLTPTGTAKNGETLFLSNNLYVPGLSTLNRTTRWYGTQRAYPYSSVHIGNDKYSLDVTDAIAQTYSSIKVVQDQTDAPQNCNFSSASNIVSLNYVVSYSFGTANLYGPSSGEVGKELNFGLQYNGNVENYTTEVTYPTYAANISKQSKQKGNFLFTLTYFTQDTNEIVVKLTSNHQNTVGTNPIQRSIQLGVVPPAPTYSLGTVTIEGPKTVDADTYTDYEVKWSGDAPANEVRHQWITDGQIENSTPTKIRAKWSAGTGHFLWAQVSYKNDTQMPKHEPITATEDVTTPGEIRIRGKSGSAATTGDTLEVKTDGVISEAPQYIFKNQWQRLQMDGTWLNINTHSQDTLTITDNFCSKSPFPEIRLLQFIEEKTGSGRRIQVPTNSILESFTLGTGPSNPPTSGYPSTTSVTCPAKVKYVAANDCVAVGVGSDNKIVYDEGDGWELGATIRSIDPIGMLYASGYWYIFGANGLTLASSDYKSQSWASPGLISGATQLAAPGFKSRVRVWALVNNKWEAYHQTPGSTSWSKSTVNEGGFTTSSPPVSFYAHGSSDNRVSAVGGRIAMITASSTAWGENPGLVRAIGSYSKLGVGGAGNYILYQMIQDSNDFYTSDDGGANWYKTGTVSNKTVFMMGGDSIIWSLGSGLKFATRDQNKYAFNSIDSNGRNFTGGCHQPAADRWIFANNSTNLHIWGG
jgi:hypothetical protein